MSGLALLTFARCIGFVFKAPGFSHPSVPPMLRAGIALVLTVGLTPAIGSGRTANGAALVVAIASELGIGAAIGIAASMLYDGAYAGGRALDDYVGIRGSVPNAELFAASGFGRIWSLALLAGFFLLDGYRIVIVTFARSFQQIPPGGAIALHGLYQLGIALPRLIIEAALLVAGPAIALTFVLQITLGAITRVVPRFASFTLSFPIVFGGAIIATAIAVPLVFPIAARPWLYLPFLR
ncbi:MAG: flagellar biosynthetic protein FliR [Candidatus Eremiobacteraeota bacterium]|nr:flagellar biosynthetic protein FliR [Candidatus Eremiobacteraeota bacterium]